VTNAILHFDKKQAEWVVCAYYGGDGNMIDVIESGRDPHIATGSMISGVPEEMVAEEDKFAKHITDPAILADMRTKLLPALAKGDYFIPRIFSIRQMGKKSNHALNYDMTANMFALSNEVSIAEAKRCVQLYHLAYPGLRSGMHGHIKNVLQKDRVLENCFGRRIRFLDAWGDDLFKEAYSAIPQSTVADAIYMGMCEVWKDTKLCGDFNITANEYDSISGQHPIDNWTKLAKVCIKIGMDYLSPECEYFGRKFNIETELKIGPNFAQCVEVPLVRNTKEMAVQLKQSYQEALQIAA